MSPLKHNSHDSLVRRPAGLTDEEWNWLIEKSLLMSEFKDISFLHSIVMVLLSSENTKPFARILKSLGINVKKGIDLQNWEHSAYRFYRHFCCEDFRNACSHSGLPFATLELTPTGYKWISSINFICKVPTDIFMDIPDMIGKTVIVTAIGMSDIESVKISCGNDSFAYYSKSVTKSFGDTMYKLKKTIIDNTKK